MKKSNRMFLILLSLAACLRPAGQDVFAAGLFAPSGLLANAVKKQVVVSWEPVKGADGYELFEKASTEKNFRRVKRTSACSVVLPDRQVQTEYYYKLRSFKKKNKNDPAGDVPQKTVLVYSAYTKAVATTVARKGSTTTLKNFLTTAMAPMGSTMYVYGGGWRAPWTIKGADGAWIGLNPKWRAFAKGKTSPYRNRIYSYRYGSGLDCSGYIGWITWNVMKTETAKKGNGYVIKSTVMAKKYASRGWGSYRKASSVRNFRAGDVMSTKGHVYLVIGECKDGSVVLAHASPPGVQICGTAARSGKKNSQAVKLARRIRTKYFPDWQKRFPSCYRPRSYLKQYHQFRWALSPGHVMSDPDGYRNMGPEEILEDLLAEPSAGRDSSDGM